MTYRPEDVPDELLTAFREKADDYGHEIDDYDARHILAAILPATKANAIREAAAAWHALGDPDAPSGPFARWLLRRAGYIERGERDSRTAGDLVRDELLSDNS